MKKRLAMLMTFAMVFTSVPVNSVTVNADTGEAQSAETEYQSDDVIMAEFSEEDADYGEEASGIPTGQTDMIEDEDEGEVDSTLSVQSDGFEVESIAVYTDDIAVTSAATDNVAVTSEDADGEGSESNITWSVADDTLTIGGSGPMKDYALIASLGEVAPWRSSTYHHVKIGAGVTRIGSYAFYNSAFTTYEGGSGLTEISEDAFYNSTWLENQTGDYITFANILVKYNGSAESIDLSAYKGVAGKAFYDNKRLTSVILPNGMTKIEFATFSGCSALSEITIPDSVTSIGGYAFGSCTALTKVTIPDSVTSIGYNAFSGCTALTEVTIPSSVTSIGSYAFAYCEKLAKVNNNSSASIGEYAFDNTLYEKYNGTSSDTITWQFDGVDTLTISGIGEMGKCGWKTNLSSSIKKVIISDGITSIADSAFSGMTALKEVVIPSSVTTIGSSAFYDTSITTVTLPEGLTSIESSAFESTDLTDITIPKSVTSIRSNAFANCDDLETVTIKTAAELSYGSFSKSSIKKLIIDCENTTTEWNDLCFANVEQLILTANVKTIADYQFRNMTSLKSVTFGENVSSIGAYAFAGCTYLQEIEIPASVKTIGKNAFADCTALAKVTFKEGLETIGAYAFLTCPNLTEVTIPLSVTKIGNYAFHSYYSLYADHEGEKEYYHYGAYSTEFIMHGYINTEAERYASVKTYNITFDPLGGSIVDCVVSLSAASYTYDGTAKTPTATLETKYGFVITPISVSYKNNVNIGTATVTVTYTGTEYTPQSATFTKTFTITEAGSNSAGATITAEQMKYMYSVMQEYGIGTSSTVSEEQLTMMLEVFYSYGFAEADAYKMLETYGISYPGSGTSNGSGTGSNGTSGSTTCTSHTWDAGTVTKAATCTTTGVKTYKCTNSGCSQTKTETIAKTAHSYGKWTTKTAATVFAAEVQQRTCSCGASEIRNYGSKLTAKLSLPGNISSLTVKKGKTVSVALTMTEGDSLVSCTSSNSKILKVNSVNTKTGTVSLKAVKAGSTTIKIKLKSDSSKTYTYKVTVTNGTIKTTKLTGVVSKKTLAKKGATFSVKPTVVPFTSTQGITYKSSNKKVATVTSKGVVKAVSPGTAKITIQSGSKKLTCTVTVAGITNVKTSLSLKAKKTSTLKPKLYGISGKATYQSSNTKVATVSASGKITAKKKGKATITVKAGSYSCTCKVTVK